MRGCVSERASLSERTCTASTLVGFGEDNILSEYGLAKQGHADLRSKDAVGSGEARLSGRYASTASHISLVPCGVPAIFPQPVDRPAAYLYWLLLCNYSKLRSASMSSSFVRFSDWLSTFVMSVFSDTSVGANIALLVYSFFIPSFSLLFTFYIFIIPLCIGNIHGALVLSFIALLAYKLATGPKGLFGLKAEYICRL